MTDDASPRAHVQLDDVEAEIREHHAQGMTQGATARALGRGGGMEGSARASGVRPADVEVEIRRMHDQGATQGETARALGVSPASLSRWSKSAGLYWGIPPRVEFARAERLRAARAQLAEQALADALEIRKRLWDKVTEHIVTADGIEQVTYNLPSARAVRDLAAAIERLSRIADHESVGALATNDALSMVDGLAVQLREWKEANP